MKKIFILLFCSMLIVSCCLLDKSGKCQVNYTVVYPDTTIVYDSIFMYHYGAEHWYTHIPRASSYKGTNYIKIGYNTFASTTCPIRINSYKTISKE